MLCFADPLLETLEFRSVSSAKFFQRQIAHYAYHTGQIVQQARNLKGEDWKSLSIARGESDAWNAKMGFTPQ